MAKEWDGFESDRGEDSGEVERRKAPEDRSGTTRQRIIRLLSEEEVTAKDISKRLGIREKEVYEHLSHISRTMTARGKRLKVAPFSCLACGYLFKERDRFTRPSRCPRCRGSRIQTPVYKLT